MHEQEGRLWKQSISRVSRQRKLCGRVWCHCGSLCCVLSVCAHTHTHVQIKTCWARTGKWRKVGGWRTDWIFRQQEVRRVNFWCCLFFWTALPWLERATLPAIQQNKLKRKKRQRKRDRRGWWTEGCGEVEETTKCVFCCQRAYCSVQIWAVSQTCYNCVCVLGGVEVCLSVSASYE